MGPYLDAAHAGRYMQSICTTCGDGCISPGTIHWRVQCVHAFSSARLRAPPSVQAARSSLGLPVAGRCRCASGSVCGATGRNPTQVRPACSLHPSCHPTVYHPIPDYMSSLLVSSSRLSSLSPRLLTPSRPRPPCLTTKSTPPHARICPRRAMVESAQGPVHPLPACTALVVNLP